MYTGPGDMGGAGLQQRLVVDVQDLFGYRMSGRPDSIQCVVMSGGGVKKTMPTIFVLCRWKIFLSFAQNDTMLLGLKCPNRAVKQSFFPLSGLATVA
jgi:hypothetical protein